MTQKGKICIVGTGHIGLPLAAVLAEAGFEVTGYDTNDDFVTRVNTTGTADFREEGLDELLTRHLHRSLTLTSSPPAGQDSTSSRWARRSRRGPSAPAWSASGWPSSGSPPASAPTPSSSCAAP